jgi:antirestriction protein ArdC
MTNKTDKNSNETRSGAQSKIEQLSTDTNPKRASVYEQITQLIIGFLARGTIPWHNPWQIQTGLPRNLVSKKAYRGINVFLLQALGYESLFWLTYRQAQELGGNVRKGEKGCPVVFWKQLTVEGRETAEEEIIPLLRYYHVFNVAQCEGLKNIPAIAETPVPTPTAPDIVVGNMPQPPTIRHGMRGAFYSPAEDSVGMPMRERFDNEAAYYATLFHELIHSTGHASRLSRSTLAESTGFGSSPYCREELIAEMGASFLCGHAGVAERTVENSAAYIHGWLTQPRAPAGGWQSCCCNSGWRFPC